MTWDDLKIHKLKLLWESGLPSSQVARAMGMTKGQIIGKVHRLKLPQRQPALARHKSAENLLIEGPYKAPFQRTTPIPTNGYQGYPYQVAKGLCQFMEGDALKNTVTYCPNAREKGVWCCEHLKRINGRAPVSH